MELNAAYISSRKTGIMLRWAFSTSTVRSDEIRSRPLYVLDHSLMSKQLTVLLLLLNLPLQCWLRGWLPEEVKNHLLSKLPNSLELLELWDGFSGVSIMFLKQAGTYIALFNKFETYLLKEVNPWLQNFLTVITSDPATKLSSAYSVSDLGYWTRTTVQTRILLFSRKMCYCFLWLYFIAMQNSGNTRHLR